jgi:hypothetical protein
VLAHAATKRLRTPEQMFCAIGLSNGHCFDRHSYSAIRRCGRIALTTLRNQPGHPGRARVVGDHQLRGDRCGVSRGRVHLTELGIAILAAALAGLAVGVPLAARR